MKRGRLGPAEGETGMIAPEPPRASEPGRIDEGLSARVDPD